MTQGYTGTDQSRSGWSAYFDGFCIGTEFDCEAEALAAIEEEEYSRQLSGGIE